MGPSLVQPPLRIQGRVVSDAELTGQQAHSNISKPRQKENNFITDGWKAMPMDQHLFFARTEKGREELLGAGQTLKPRQRQVLFLVNDAISVGEMKAKLPSCQELENILEQLWDEGYIGQVKQVGAQARASDSVPEAAPTQPDISSALRVLQGSRLEAARQHALGVLAGLVGEQSPVYARVRAAQDLESFNLAIAQGRKLLSAVASSNQASAFERGVQAILNLPETGQVPAVPSNPGQLNGIDQAKGHALGIIASLVGERSPVYARINGTHTRAEFIEAVGASKKVIAAVASASRAQDFEQEVMERLQRH